MIEKKRADYARLNGYLYFLVLEFLADSFSMDLKFLHVMAWLHLFIYFAYLKLQLEEIFSLFAIDEIYIDDLLSLQTFQRVT